MTRKEANANSEVKYCPRKTSRKAFNKASRQAAKLAAKRFAR